MLMECYLERKAFKRPAICKKEGDVLVPVMFFQKAKNATDADFEQLIDFLCFRNPYDTD